MQSSKSRTPETAKVSSPSSVRSTRETLGSPEVGNSRTTGLVERKPSSKAAPLAEKRVMRISEEEPPRTAREEKARAMGRADEMKHGLGWRRAEGEDTRRVKVLEEEVEKAKDSEMKMLESLVAQTKQLEAAKIELEEAKLEVRNLRESSRCTGGSTAGQSHLNLGRFLGKPRSLDPRDDAARALENELRLAIEAEENNKKAMDDLAFTLKEVTTELNQLKEKLPALQSELDDARAEADRSKSALEAAEERLRVIGEEAERLKVEAEESTAAWNAKENGFVDCMKASEEEIAKMRHENFRLSESQRIAREESSKLRDIMKQALNEATVVKEALEIARSENSQLKDLLAERERTVEVVKQDYENLKVREAAALDSVEELKNLIAETAATTEAKNGASAEAEPSTAGPEAVAAEVPATGAPARLRSEQWWGEENHRVEDGFPGHHPGRPGPDLPGSRSQRITTSSGQKDRVYASLSCVSDLNVDLHKLVGGDHLNPDGFEHPMERIQLDGPAGDDFGIPTKQKKRRQILRRFGDLLRRGRA